MVEINRQQYLELAYSINAFNIVKNFDIAYYKLEKEGTIPSFDVDRQYIDLIDKYGIDFVKWCRNQNTNSHIRYMRLKKKIQNYLSLGACVFATLTFRNDVLDGTDIRTRRQYVSRFLKSISAHYVANIDFSPKEREHYHALIMIDRVESIWRYGFTWYEKVRNTKNNYKLAKYVSKLTNHACKLGIKSSYIYSKDKENIDWDNL